MFPSGASRWTFGLRMQNKKSIIGDAVPGGWEIQEDKEKNEVTVDPGVTKVGLNECTFRLSSGRSREKQRMCTASSPSLNSNWYWAARNEIVPLSRTPWVSEQGDRQKECSPALFSQGRPMPRRGDVHRRPYSRPQSLDPGTALPAMPIR